MATSARTKFAGFLRGLFGRGDDRAPARPAVSAAPAPAPAPASRPTSSAPSHTTPAAQFVPAPAKTGPAPAAAAAPARTAPSDIEIRLAPVIAALPLELKAKLVATPAADLTLHLRAEMVIHQLAFGAVKIAFGELRRLVPGVFVNSGGEFDKKLITLPLQEILPRLNPALLARRATKKVEVAEEIVGPFAERGRGFTFTTKPLKGPSAPASVPTSVPEPPAELVPPMAIRQTSPPPMAPQIPQRSITPAGPPAQTGAGPGNGPSSLPISPLSTRSASATSGNGHGSNGNGNGHPQPPTPGMRTGTSNGNGHGATPAPLKMSAPPAAPAAQLTPEEEVTIRVALGDLCGNWPEVLKEEILESSLAQTSVALESSLIVPGLRRGRIVVRWQQLRMLARPGSAPTPIDNLELELPLKVIAPLFVAAQKNSTRPQTRASVSADIPDLFFGFPQPTPAAPAAPVAPPAPAAALVPPLPKAPEQNFQDTNYYSAADKAMASPAEEAPARMPETDFVNRLAHPKDVVARAAALPGVAGSIVAMQDGLRVASQIPAELNSDTLAAFLPQIFERVNQSTRELRMGALNNVNFTVGNIPWKIFRVNAVYFAAFGCAGEQLPSAQLAQLAAQLDRKKAQ
ncbi:MAG TPA: hypothetical protein VL970_02890 [Candidatus Acidoferrales bacterium]|nr:hypothetical protein [Candidatus Acidoferrales bacterium]